MPPGASEHPKTGFNFLMHFYSKLLTNITCINQDITIITTIVLSISSGGDSSLCCRSCLCACSSHSLSHCCQVIIILFMLIINVMIFGTSDSKVSETFETTISSVFSIPCTALLLFVTNHKNYRSTKCKLQTSCAGQFLSKCVSQSQ